MRRGGIAGFLLAALLSSALTACSIDEPASEDTAATTSTVPPAIVIAVGGPFSGEAKPLGDQIRAGAKLAADQINAGGGVAAGPLKGVRLELDESFDHGNTAGRAVEGLLRAVDDARYLAFVGAAPPDADGDIGRIASEAGLSYLTAVAAPPGLLAAARAQKSVFAVAPTAVAFAVAAAEELYRTGHRRPSVLHLAGGDGERLAEAVAKPLQEKGAPVVATEAFGPADADFVALLERVRGADPDSMVLIGDARIEATIVRQADQVGLGAAAFDASRVANTESFVRQAGDLANGVVGVAGIDVQRDTPPAKGLVDAYRAATGGPTLPEAAAFAYESVQAVAAAFADGATGRLDLSDHLHRISLPDTGVGPLQFSPDGSRLGGRLTAFTIASGIPVVRAGYEQAGPISVREIALER